MKMARILIAVLIAAMMFSVVGCDGTTQNGGNSNGDNASQTENNSNKNDNFGGGLFNKEYVDEEYEPNMEGLVGIAVYEVPKGEDYPFECEQKLLKSDQRYYGFNKWEKFYFYYIADGITYRTSKNVAYEEKWENDLKFISASYSAKREQIYWGYVYEVNDEIYIVATNDLVNFDENNSATKTMNIDGAQVSFTVTYEK